MEDTLTASLCEIVLWRIMTLHRCRQETASSWPPQGHSAATLPLHHGAPPQNNHNVEGLLTPSALHPSPAPISGRQKEALPLACQVLYDSLINARCPEVAVSKGRCVSANNLIRGLCDQGRQHVRAVKPSPNPLGAHCQRKCAISTHLGNFMVLPEAENLRCCCWMLS
ncbi:hypothetical protein NA57DRAFT_53505 [Rhizodiscina lignyota]|uniref:Uncharacterized protein n=1 Tax=Rhizodiscina lignyota TaxID=1504668 RepID=A0A9P4M8E7_9PEZI|nr:hypothetical protein NA57DRAFT_53505 [Rhizodiscina lignyota]